MAELFVRYLSIYLSIYPTWFDLLRACCPPLLFRLRCLLPAGYLLVCHYVLAATRTTARHCLLVVDAVACDYPLIVSACHQLSPHWYCLLPTSPPACLNACLPLLHTVCCLCCALSGDAGEGEGSDTSGVTAETASASTSGAAGKPSSIRVGYRTENIGTHR